MKLRTAIVGMVALVTASFAAAPALATNPAQDQIDAIIAEHGGVQISANEVSYDDGATILTVPTGRSVYAVGTCATNKFCAYSQNNLLGLKLSFSSCSASNSTSSIAPVRSVANARSSGNVYAYNGSTIVLTVAAGSATNTTATITRLGC